MSNRASGYIVWLSLPLAVFLCNEAKSLDVTPAQTRLAQFDGLWDGPDVVLFNLAPLGKSEDPESPTPPLKDEYLRQFQARADRLRAISQGAALLPSDGTAGRNQPGAGPPNRRHESMPGMMIGGMGAPMEFIVAQGRLYIISGGGGIRRIYVDGRRHPSPDDIVPNGIGHSVGHWEGDTLVVDTIGLLAGSIDVQTAHSDSLHIVERFRMLNADSIQDEITLTDSQALARPWISTRIYKRSKLTEVVEPDDDAAPVSDRHF